MGGPISTSSWVHLPAGVKARLFRFSAALLLTSGHANIPRVGAGLAQPGWMGKMQGLFAEAMPHGQGGDSSAQCLAADELMKKRGPDNYLAAYKQYKSALGADPSNDDLKLKMAEASVSYLRALTDANAVMIDGISDSPENKKLWREYAPEAYTTLKELHQAKPSDAKIHVLMTEAFTYSTSSKGILKAAVKGDGFTFMKYVDQIVKQHPTFDSGIPYIFKGAFLLAAPWPLKDLKGAADSFHEAIKIEPRSIRNNYYGGISAWYNGDLGKARDYFKKVLEEGESIAHTEKDVRAFFLREAKRGLEEANRKLGEAK